MKDVFIHINALKLFICCCFPFSLFAQTDFWVHTNDGPYYEINSFVFSHGNIFTTGDGGIFQSSNGGQFWSRLNYDFNFCAVTCMAIDSDGNMFAGTQNGLYFSSDAGSSWAQKNIGLNRAYVGAIMITPSGDIFVGTSGPAIFKSTDNGNSWQSVATFTVGNAVSSILVTDSGSIIVGVVGASWIEKTQSSFDSIRIGGIYRSKDGGMSWDTVYVGIPKGGVDSYYKFIVSLCKGTNGTLYAGVSDWPSFDKGGMLISVDDGKTWSPSSFELAVTCLIANLSGLVFAGTIDGIYSSSNEGSQWTQISDTAARSMVFDENGKLWLGFSIPGGVACSSDNGNTWESPSGGLIDPDVTCLAFDSHGTLFAGINQGGGISYTTDNGNLWHHSSPSSFDWINAITVNDSNIVYASGNLALYRSRNGGHTWDTIGFPISNLPIYSFYMNGPGSILAASHQGIFRSTTDGTYWEPLLKDSMTNYAIVQDPGGWIFAGTDSGVIRSTDNGASWVAVNSGLPNTGVRAMTITNEGKILAGTWENGIFQSSDRGNTWTGSSSGATGNSIQCFAVNPKGDIYAGIAGGGVCKSTDGSTWQPINSGLTFINNTTSLAISPSGYIFAGTMVRGVFKSVESTMSIRGSSSLRPLNFELEQNYPNPFNPSTIITYQLPANTLVTLKVYDELGRLVRALVNDRQPAGIQSVTFNAGTLSSGVYFYRLTAGNYVSTKKLMLLK